MTENEKLIKALKAHGKKLAADPELARLELLKSGIYTKTGKLKKIYRCDG